MSRSVLLKNLGKISYQEALKVQTTLVNAHLESLNSGTKPATTVLPLDTLLVVEHHPVYTVGVRADRYSVEEESRLKRLGAEFHRTNRGGLITFHGPGQLVVYPILNLANYKKSVRWYVDRLEQTLIDTCGRLGVTATTCEHTGVWVNDNKIAAIGIHARRFITNHGVALNCNVDMRWFDEIDPCGIVGRGVTSLSRQLGDPITVSAALPHLRRAFESKFECQIVDGAS